MNILDFVDLAARLRKLHINIINIDSAATFSKMVLQIGRLCGNMEDLSLTHPESRTKVPTISPLKLYVHLTDISPFALLWIVSKSKNTVLCLSCHSAL